MRFHPPEFATATSIHPTAVIDPTATLHDPVRIDALAVIGPGCEIGAGSVLHAGVVVGAGSRIGEHCVLYPQAVLYHQVTLGNRVMVHAGAVLGADGFGFVETKAGSYQKIPQIGTVVVEDDVEIGACATIDRATLGETRICRGVKIDNLVHIAHNCLVGDDTAIAAQAGISGSTKLGSRVRLAGQVGLAGHIRIADDVIIGPGSGVPGDISEPGMYLGFPIEKGRTWLRYAIEWARMADTRKEVQRLKQRLEQLEKGAGVTGS
jgi:UDP-3-O-[3-hydroxymyristoyl] glucosamine N-acyltransferase